MSHQEMQHLYTYADDTQFYVAESPDGTGLIIVLKKKKYFRHKHLDVATAKPGFNWYFSHWTWGLGLAPNQQARNLCLIFDSDFNFNAHVGFVTIFALYHQRFCEGATNKEIPMHAFISSRLD